MQPWPPPPISGAHTAFSSLYGLFPFSLFFSDSLNTARSMLRQSLPNAFHRRLPLHPLHLFSPSFFHPRSLTLAFFFPFQRPLDEWSGAYTVKEKAAGLQEMLTGQLELHSCGHGLWSCLCVFGEGVCGWNVEQKHKECIHLIMKEKWLPAGIM